MGIELSIMGIRKIRPEEVEELSGKSRQEIEKSKYFRKIFPDAPFHSWYWCKYQFGDGDRDIRHMLIPVKDSDGNTIYVYWVEELGCYSHMDDYDREMIDEIFEIVTDDIDWTQEFRVVDADVLYDYMDIDPVSEDPDEEKIALLYG